MIWFSGTAEAGGPLPQEPFTAYRNHRRLIAWIGWAGCAGLVALTGVFVELTLTGPYNAWATAGLCGFFACLFVPITYGLIHTHVVVSDAGVTVINVFSTYQIPWCALDQVKLELLHRGDDIPDLYGLLFITQDGVIRAESPIGLASPTSRMMQIVSRIVEYRDRMRTTDPRPATAVKVSGAAARLPKWRRPRPVRESFKGDDGIWHEDGNHRLLPPTSFATAAFATCLVVVLVVAGVQLH
jgi:hypothetical protein